WGRCPAGQRGARRNVQFLRAKPFMPGVSRPLGNFRVAIRADASSRIGSGHVMRCLTLAERLREDGADMLFVCRAHDGNLVETIEQRGFSVATLSPAADRDELAGYAGWLGVSQKD